jgi:hypothetical protein
MAAEMKSKTHHIERVVNSIDWRKIKSYHRKLGIVWEYEEDKESVQRIPTVSELREDFRTLLHHMMDQEITYISYGNWIIFWENDPEEVRVIFRIADYIVEEKGANLEEELRSALEKEDYEKAAIIRDKINSKSGY